MSKNQEHAYRKDRRSNWLGQVKYRDVKLPLPHPVESSTLFVFAFNSDYAMEGAKDRTEDEAYRHPTQFYFSGFPAPPVNAPFVKQIITNIESIPPKAKDIWNPVEQICTVQPLPNCALFNPDDSDRRDSSLLVILVDGDRFTRSFERQL